MTAPLEFELLLDADETVRVTRALRGRAHVWFDRGIWAVAAVMAVLYFLLPVELRRLWLLGTAAFVLAGLIGLWSTWYMRRYVRRTYRETPSLQAVQVYRFSDAGLTITGGSTTLTFAWDAFIKVVETPEFFLFYYGKRSAHYLPKRVAHDDVQVRALRDLITAYTSLRSTA